MNATLIASLLGALPAVQDAPPVLEPMDVFELEWASDPRPSPHGDGVVYVRGGMDALTDRTRADLWFVSYDGRDHRPWTSSGRAISPRWSPTGDRLAFLSGGQIWLRWTDTGETAPITRLQSGPSSLSWSPDGKWLAFSMSVDAPCEPFVTMPSRPEGATWAPPPIVITELKYRADGAGYLEPSNSHVFVIPAEGGTPRQLTSGAYDHAGPLVWTPDGEQLLCSANRREDKEQEPTDSEVYAIEVATGELTALTKRFGPDGSPALSPDGVWLAWTGHDEQFRGYQGDDLYIRRLDGGEVRCLTSGLDRSVGSPRWTADGRGVFVSYDDRGSTKIARVSLDGKVEDLASGVGGTSLGRPYGSGSFTTRGDRVVFTHNTPQRPADVAVLEGDDVRLLTHLNRDLLDNRTLAQVSEHTCTSSAGGREVHYWVAKPPGFDPAQRYPLLLEIHGGPFQNYGARFAMEVQLFAAAGYVVVYSNPRGSTSYGDEFANLIHHNYPGEDYDDLMSVVDAVAAEEWLDGSRLFVTGGSGGGVLTATIVGRTDRFAAAVVAKPVINWISFALTSDAYNFFWRWWFPGYPWDHHEHYWKRSPLSLVGNVTTPTMLLTGEADYRTPISESEQYYQALKLRGIDTAFVRIPEASHGITARPSNMIAKVLCILEWFGRYR